MAQAVVERPTRQHIAAASTECVCWVVCPSELYALILEDKIIKTCRPIANKRQKKFLLQQYITLNTSSNKPRFQAIDIDQVQTGEFDRLFGPFSDKFIVKEVFAIGAKYFGVSDNLPGSSLPFPSFGQGEIEGFTKFLAGEESQVLTIIQNKMTACSRKNLYEEAIKHRENLNFCERYLERQRFISRFAKFDLDIDSPEYGKFYFRRGAFLEDEFEGGFLAGAQPWLLFDRAMVVYTWLRTIAVGSSYKFNGPTHQSAPSV